MGKLYVVGAGSCNYDDLTIKADKTLRLSDFIYCDEKMYQMLFEHYNNTKILSNSYSKTRERCINAVNKANDNIVSIVGSGDTGIYGIASIIFELTEEITPNLDIEIIPGLTSAISGASLLGAPLMKDFAVISLSDSLSEKAATINRIIAAAQADFGIVFYSPKNPTYYNLISAKEILLKYRSSETIVGVVKDIGSTQQEIKITNLSDLDVKSVDSFTTIFIGRNDTRVSKTKVKKMITPLY